MESLDEKAGPSALAMDVDEPVSVRDRMYFITRPCACRHDACNSSRILIPIDEAFAAKQLPDLGHEVEDMQVFTWRLSKWRTLEKKLTSPEFDCGGHRWCVAQVPHAHG